MTASDLAADSRERAIAWCLRLAEGAASLEEQLAFEIWLEESPANQLAFEQAAALWRSVPEVRDMPEVIAARADALEAMRAANGRRWLRAVNRPILAWAAAACLLLFVCASLFVVIDAPDRYQTGVGERRVVRLSDGSRISLDAATRVEVDYDGSGRRLALLDGRAKFDVAKDPRRPFFVEAGGKSVVATGTAFSVELIDREMRVILYEGHVAVLEQGAPGAPPRHVRLGKPGSAADQQLRPGRELVVPRNGSLAVVVPTDLPRSLSWEGGQLNFTDEPLGRAVVRVNRYSDRKLEIGDEAAGRVLVSGAFNAGDTEGFVDGVTTLFPVAARQEDGKILLVSARE